MFVLDLLLEEEPWLFADSICDLVPRVGDTPTIDTVADIVDLISTATRDDQQQLTDSIDTMYGRLQAERRGSPDTQDISIGNKLKALLREQMDISSFNARQNEDYVGRYHDFAYGNLTVAINEEDDSLVMSYGPSLVLNLSPVTESIFQAAGVEPFWHLSYTVTFLSNGELFDRVTVTFESAAPPTFYRDQTDAEAPSPPDLCE